MAAFNAQSAPGFNGTDTFRSVTNVDAIPRADDVTALWTADPNVRNALSNNSANVNALGVISLKAGAAGSPNTQSAVVELNENFNQLTSGGLVVGMLGTSLPGGGLAPGDSLRFRIQRNGASLIDQTFTSNPTLLSYFQNNVLNLGPQNAATGGANLDLQFLFDFTGNLNAGTGAGIEFLVGTANALQAGSWASGSGGSWGTAGNWSGNVPNSPGASAAFGATSAAKTITLDQNITIGTLTLNSASASYTIASGTGGSALILDNAGAQPAITVSAGSHEIAAPVQLGSGTNVTIGPGAALKISGRLTGALDSLNLSGGPDAWSARLDLTDNDLIVHGGGAAGLAIIANQLKEGFNGGDWNGTGGITSSSAAGSTLRKMALGYGTMTGTFDGQTVSSSDVIVKYTLVGDANLDGNVDFSDLLALAQNYGKPGTPWSGGDFNYDGATNFSDLLALAQNYGASVSGGFSAAFAWAAVPEPGTLGWLSGGFGLLCRRRRRASGAATR